jgi:hypothetical protein
LVKVPYSFKSSDKLFLVRDNAELAVVDPADELWVFMVFKEPETRARQFSKEGRRLRWEWGDGVLLV